MELKLHRFLNSLSPEDRALSKYKDICLEKVKEYGNIYFYTPIPKLVDFHKDTSSVEIIHGNNSSGKTYGACAEVAYRITGQSPYRDYDASPYGIRHVWIITQTFEIQRGSSQQSLFSNLDAPVRDIGLLPELETLESYGCEISWHEKNVIKSIKFPDFGCGPVTLDFKSMEQRAFSIAGAPVDDILIDEIAPESVYDEAVARVLRKYGTVIMSCLVEDVEKSYLITDVYSTYEQDTSKGRKSEISFYFLEAEDNVFLDPQEIKKRKALLSESGKAWRFSKGGRFIINPKGLIVYEDYDDTRHLVDDLITQFDPLRTVYRAWDLGYDKPACVCFQIDKYNRLIILCALLGNKIQLNNFIEQVTGHLEGILQEKPLSYHEILPHDANRMDGNSPNNAVSIFDDKGLKSFDVIYVKAEPAIVAANKWFSQYKAGKPAVMIDSQYAHLLGNCCALYTRDEATGKPKTSKKTDMAHISDAFKLGISYVERTVKSSDIFKQTENKMSKPGYTTRIKQVSQERAY